MIKVYVFTFQSSTSTGTLLLLKENKLIRSLKSYQIDLQKMVDNTKLSNYDLKFCDVVYYIITNDEKVQLYRELIAHTISYNIYIASTSYIVIKLIYKIL